MYCLIMSLSHVSSVIYLIRRLSYFYVKHAAELIAMQFFRHIPSGYWTNLVLWVVKGRHKQVNTKKSWKNASLIFHVFHKQINWKFFLCDLVTYDSIAILKYMNWLLWWNILRKYIFLDLYSPNKFSTHNKSHCRVGKIYPECCK